MHPQCDYHLTVYFQETEYASIDMLVLMKQICCIITKIMEKKSKCFVHSPKDLGIFNSEKTEEKKQMVGILNI